MDDKQQSTEPLFLATLASTGVDYHGIVGRPKWNLKEANARIDQQKKAKPRRKPRGE